MAIEIRETEWKYEAPPGATLPDFTDLPQVAAQTAPEKQTLRAVYHDTEDLRLIRAGITLRRRTGGQDAGWHLKLPDSSGSRLEIQLPARRDLPAELSDLVRVWTRGLPLKPVARITTIRRRQLLRDEAGTTLAEVVVDDVTAESLGETTTKYRWDEVEVELAEGDLRLLKAADKRLRSNGMLRAAHTAKLERALADRLAVRTEGPRYGCTSELTSKSSAADVVLAYVRSQVDAIVAYDPKVRRAEPDAVHQMRVATRRLRSTLRTFGEIFPDDGIRWLAEELKWLSEILGQARDEEVVRDHLLANLAGLPAQLVVGPVGERIAGHFIPRQAAAHISVVAELDGDRYLALLSGLDLLLDSPALTRAAGRKATVELPGMMTRALRRVDRRMTGAYQTARGPERDLALHESRKAAKRARYAAETVRPVLGQQARRSAKAMKALQTTLGEHQDCVLAGQTAFELGMLAHTEGENAFTYGVLHERDMVAAAAIQDQAERMWKQSRAK